MYLNILLLLCLTSFAAASPAKSSKSSPTPTGHSTAVVTAGFEELPMTPIGEDEGTPVPNGYKNLCWSGINYGFGIPGVPATFLAIGTQTAFTDIYTRTTGGAVNATIYSTCSTSTVAYFSLQKINIGCAVETTADVWIAQTCAFQLPGFKQGKLVGQQTFTVSTPSTQENNPLQPVAITGINKVDTLSIQVIATSLSTPPLAETQFDNLTFQEYFS